VVRAFRLWLVVMVAVLQGHAGVGEWKTYTAKREIRDVVRSGAMLWSATSGGLFGYDLATGRYAEFTTSEGLMTIDLTAVAVDESGSLWIGAANGILHKYSPSSGEWRTITDIARLHIRGVQLTEGLLNRVEHGIRLYDPCLSCATHLHGRLGMRVELLSADGKVLDRASV